MSTTLADLRRMNLEEQRQDADNASADRASAAALTEVRTSVSAEGGTDARKEVPAGGREEASAPVSPSLPTEARQQARADFLARVRASLEEGRAAPPGGVKATVEMSPGLSRRAKIYGLDHKGVSVRQICLALLEEFLTEEGY